MLYFREAEQKRLRDFCASDRKKAMAIYGRRRAGKTALVLHFMERNRKKNVVYYQCASFDYRVCLNDFISVLKPLISENAILDSLQTFKDVFAYIQQVSTSNLVVIIDEFPFLCKKNTDALVEFQWVIDHGLGNAKLILLGSNMSFMKAQINDMEAPLYGRFDEMMEIRPFTFQEIYSLFPDYEDAVNVYAQTGGVAQYAMLFKDYPSVSEATRELFFDKDGRLFREADNMLMQEVRDVTTYVSIMRAISGREKDSGQIAQKTGLDPRGIFSYINKLLDLGLVSEAPNPLSEKKRDKKYQTKDLLFRFNYTFIEPYISMITTMGKKAESFILNDQYHEYLGAVYEDIIRESCYEFALQGKLPFMPSTVGKWWGNIMKEGVWQEGEVDLVAYDNAHIVIGECKFRNKKVGIKELELLKEKAAFIPVKGREIYYLLASKGGFTKDVQKENVILIQP